MGTAKSINPVYGKDEAGNRVILRYEENGFTESQQKKAKKLGKKPHELTKHELETPIEELKSEKTGNTSKSTIKSRFGKK